MYEIALYLHSYTRWLVLFCMAWALWRVWHGMLTGRAWTRRDRSAGLALAISTSLQLILGWMAYLANGSLARVAVADFSAAMKVMELRFFGLEHPLQMTIAITLAHLGSARAKRAKTDRSKFRWGVVCFSLTTILILSAIPWWRPLLRLPAAMSQRFQTAAVEYDALPDGDAVRGEQLFLQGAEGAAACSVCHTLSDEVLVGPGLGNVGVRADARVEGDSAELYLYHSIVNPSQYVVDGFANAMPPNYAEKLSAQQIADLIAYLTSLSEPKPTE